MNPKCLMESSRYCNRFFVLLSSALAVSTDSFVSLIFGILRRSLGWREGMLHFSLSKRWFKGFPGRLLLLLPVQIHWNSVHCADATCPPRPADRRRE